MFESWHGLGGILSDAGIKLTVSVLCGFALGFERQWKDKPAGLRTISLITVGSTLFMVVSQLIAYVADWPEGTSNVDPSRIAAQVVSGIGFLGAGSIIRARGDVQGLTTAATIWVAAGIGLCVGIGFPGLAVIITGLVLVLLVVMDPIGQWISRRGEWHRLELVAPNDVLVVQRITHLFKQHYTDRDEIEVHAHSDDEVRIVASYPITSSDTNYLLLDALAQIDGVRGIRRHT